MDLERGPKMADGQRPTEQIMPLNHWASNFSPQPIEHFDEEFDDFARRTINDIGASSFTKNLSLIKDNNDDDQTERDGGQPAEPFEIVDTS